MIDQPFIIGLMNNGLLLAAFGWLLKTLVSDKLKTISNDISELKKSRAEDSGKITQIDGRVIRLEEWRENTSGVSTLGRRTMDHCPMPGCPHEAIR